MATHAHTCEQRGRAKWSALCRAASSQLRQLYTYDDAGKSHEDTPTLIPNAQPSLDSTSARPHQALPRFADSCVIVNKVLGVRPALRLSRKARNMY